MLDLLKSVNDSMHQIAITGYEVLEVLLCLNCGSGWKLMKRDFVNVESFHPGRATFASWAVC